MTRIKNGQDPWEGTLSHEIYNRLQEEANGKKEVKVDGKGSMHETFCFGDDRAHLYKRLEDGSVGSRNGIIRAYVELHEVNHKDWWKKAIGDNINRSVRLLPVSLEQLAQDAQLVKEEAWILNPKEVVLKKEGSSRLNGDQKLIKKREISHVIMETLSDLCGNNFKIQEEESALRLMPLTEEAKLIDLEKNLPYQNIIKKISDYIPTLKKNLKIV